MVRLVLLIGAIWIPLACLLGLALGRLMRGPRPRTAERRKK